MATILIDGLAVEAAQLVCDPLPGKPIGPRALRVQFKAEDPRRFDGDVPIVFPLGADLYRGEFRHVAYAKHPDGRIEHTFISDAPVTEYRPRLWERPLALMLKWRGRARDRHTSD